MGIEDIEIVRIKKDPDDLDLESHYLTIKTLTDSRDRVWGREELYDAIVYKKISPYVILRGEGPVDIIAEETETGKKYVRAEKNGKDGKNLFSLLYW